MNAYMNQYQQTQVTTASPERILIMLYEGAIRFTGRARLAIEDGDPACKRESISRAVAIVSYLSDTLDHNAGWDGSEELDGLYAFMIRELTQANLKNDVKALGMVEKLLSELRDTWLEAINKVHAEKHQEEKTPPAQTEKIEKGKLPANYRPLSLSL
ncbi:MAG: flagellar export chaperone FliS [Desulfuromonadaceae bacterium]